MSFSIQIEPEWNMIKKIKDQISADQSILERGRDFQDSVLLASIELLENALKYSEGDKDLPVFFSLDIDDKRCEISVTNTSKNEESIQAIMDVLKKLENGNAFDLYVERLEKLRDNPDGFSRMGLIRIAYEAEFQLKAHRSKDQLTITATCEL